MTDKKKIEALDPSDPFTKARLDWGKTPEKERQDFYKHNAAAIDRWQAEADAMTDNDEDKKIKG